ncbi:MAG: amino acid carrier protein [Eubacterium sp.]|nr:amino acid carrier protein [Eubacterium sp.]MCM1304539.1 amino acid carrier protein [Butyrivibrio sp.]MCM1344184.1 amino acid carrier protein [Muribaculaceae bacterium]MCM1409623.1 amino acid carrier protein [Lachnospiraceae bacterium]
MKLEEWIRRIDDLVWGPWLLFLLLGTGIYLMVRLRFLPLKNLKFAFACALGREKQRPAARGKESVPSVRRPSRHVRKRSAASGQISALSSLTTELAATMGTGNIIGVATAMALGGPGALFWMVAASLIGMATKLVESTLSVTYRSKNEAGQTVGGPMYTMVTALPGKLPGRILGFLFALFAVFASFGMGNMTQANSIADALNVTFQVPKAATALAVTVLTILIVLGGISHIAKLTRLMVPFMGIFYLLGTVAVIVTHWQNIPLALGGILTAAFCPRAVSGGLFGTVLVSAGQSLRWGVSRGIFSNEAGLGAAGISAAAADTEDPVRQGYISMTGVFLDTVVMCSLTGLALAVSGAFGMTDAKGNPLTGTALTLAAFQSTLGDWGEKFISVSIVLFAFATIAGWAYQGERAFEFLMRGKVVYNIWYRFVYALMAFVGCVCSLEVVWNLSDICNALMAVPNLVCVLWLSGGVCGRIREYGG